VHRKVLLVEKDLEAVSTEQWELLALGGSRELDDGDGVS
jgi:hypothetical protein